MDNVELLAMVKPQVLPEVCNMKWPTISVIIPAYNVGQYIEAALDSLNGQQSLPDEVIIIDDGSADDTLRIIRQFDHAYPVSILSTVNQGQGAARNLGVSLAKGDYIYFFDSDDIVKPDFISDIRDLIAEQEMPDIIFFSGKCLYETEWIDEQSLGYDRGFHGRFNNSVDLLESFNARGIISPMPCLYITKRSLWVDHDLKFIDYYHEDEHILFPLIFSAKSYYVTDAVYFIRRVRDGSTMTQKKTVKHVLGLRATVCSLISMKTSIADRSLRKFVSRRALHFLKRYICLCRRTEVACDKAMLFSAFVALRSPRVPMYSLYYSSSGQVRNAVKRMLGAGEIVKKSR